MVLAAAARPASAQVVKVTVKSAGELLSQFRTLARETNPAAAGQMLDGLDALENQGGLKWLDRDKPVSATADLVPQAPGGPPSVPAITVFLPVTGRDAFLDTLKGLGLTVDDQPGVKGFSHKIAGQGAGQALYLLADPPAGYVVATTVASGADRLRAVKPADLKPSRPGTVLVGVRIDQDPEPIKAAALNNVIQRNNASPAQGRRDRRPVPGPPRRDQVLRGRLQEPLRDGRELTLDADVSTKADRLTLALAVDAKPGTPLANSLNTFGARRGRFLNLWADAGVTLQGVLPTPERCRAQLRSTIEQAHTRPRRRTPPKTAGSAS